MKSEESASAVFGKAVAVACIYLLAGVLYGWVLSVLWAWYLVPRLHVPQISVIQGVGICLVAELLTYHAPTKRDKDYDVAFMIACNILLALEALGIGFLFHFFM